MDHLRDNQVIQLFFFSIVLILGVYLYLRSPEIPEQNTYHYVQSEGLFEERRDLLAEDGFEVTEMELALADGSESIVQVTIYGRVPDSCTELQNVKETYVNREFKLTLVPVEKPYAVCQALESDVLEEVFIDMGALSLGEYTVTAQDISETFSMQSLLRNRLEADIASSTATGTSDLSAALGNLLK